MTLSRTIKQAAVAFALASSALTPAIAEDIVPVFQHALPNVPGKNLTVVEVVFAPGTRAEAHRHGLASVYAYVLSGTVRSQLGDEPAHIYRAGEGWFEPPGAHHLLTENMDPKVPARLLVTFVADSSEPLKIPDAPKETQMQTTPSTSTPAVRPAPQQMVDALYSAFGDNHSRAVHAKGIMATGYFEPSSEATALSKASIFAHGRLSVLVRFSNFTGIPQIPDTIGDANPRGLAVKFQLPDGTSADVVAHSFNGFPTATAGEFRELLLAIGASGAGASKPTALDTFLGAHPIARTFLTTQKPPPESYATLSYFGVNAFEFTDATGHRRFIRYRFVPVGGEAVLTPGQLAAKGPNYLQTELPERLARGPVAFSWYAQISESGDVTGDPSVAWPESRKLVKLGVIHVERMTPDPAGADRSTMFAPLNVPDGIAPADPMLTIRQGAYPLSFHHRQ